MSSYEMTFLLTAYMQAPGHICEKQYVTHAQSILPHAGNKGIYYSYEMKMEESEKAGSRWESNPEHLWLEPPAQGKML